jgi:hypothetical protein
LLDRLPDEWPQDLRPAIKKQVNDGGRKVVVLDDDPTGQRSGRSWKMTCRLFIS